MPREDWLGGRDVLFRHQFSATSSGALIGDVLVPDEVVVGLLFGLWLPEPALLDGLDELHNLLCLPLRREEGALWDGLSCEGHLLVLAAPLLHQGRECRERVEFVGIREGAAANSCDLL